MSAPISSASPDIAAYIGLGSNLDQPVRQVQSALTELQRLPATQMAAHSSLYRSAPVGPQDQPDFINAVALLHTRLSAEQLLDQLQSLEHQHQRVRTQQWGPRTLDLDILLYGDQQISSERLQIPHPFLPERSFVLYPLAEIAPRLQLPDGSSLQSLLADCAMGSLERLAL